MTTFTNLIFTDAPAQLDRGNITSAALTQAHLNQMGLWILRQSLAEDDTMRVTYTCEQTHKWVTRKSEVIS